MSRHGSDSEVARANPTDGGDHSIRSKARVRTPSAGNPGRGGAAILRWQRTTCRVSRAMWGHLGESWERNLVEFDRAYSGLGSFDDLARCPTDRSTVTANLRNGSERHQASVCLCGGSSPTVSRTSTWECDHRTPAGVDRSHTLAFTGSTPSSLREPC